MSAPESLQLRPRCVSSGGQRVDGVYVIPLPCGIARYLVVVRGQYYALAHKEDVIEFLRGRLGREVEVGPCPSG
jgi:hypothetical protein